MGRIGGSFWIPGLFCSICRDGLCRVSSRGDLSSFLSRIHCIDLGDCTFAKDACRSSGIFCLEGVIKRGDPIGFNRVAHVGISVGLLHVANDMN